MVNVEYMWQKLIFIVENHTCNYTFQVIETLNWSETQLWNYDPLIHRIELDIPKRFDLDDQIISCMTKIYPS